MQKWLPLGALLGLTLGCATHAVNPAVESMDAYSGVTLATLREPIELVQTGPLPFGKRASFAYLGPVEWNRMGAFTYGIWLDIAPGDDKVVGDIHAPAAVVLVLSDGSLELKSIDPEQRGKEGYRPVVTWGQSGYYALSVEALKRLGKSEFLAIDVRAVQKSTIRFLPIHATTHALLNEYVNARLGLHN